MLMFAAVFSRVLIDRLAQRPSADLGDFTSAAHHLNFS
jgi:hypothetical protein